jgi:hypothetical protein
MFNARRNTVGEAGEKISKAAQDAAAKVQKAGQSVTVSPAQATFSHIVRESS